MVERIIELKNSIRLNVRYTQTRKTTILFLHFSEGTAQIFNGIIPYFEDSFNIVIPDLRGHGKSDKPFSGYHIDDMAEDVKFLLEELKIDKCHIVGSSLGAEVAVSFAAAYPEKVLSLVCEGAIYNEFGEYGLFNSSEEEIKKEKEKRFVNTISKRTERTYNSKAEIIEYQTKFFKRNDLWNDLFLEFIESNICDTEDGKYTYCTPLYVSNEYVLQYWDFKFEEYYKKIDCPVLFIPSEEEWNNEKIRKSIDGFCAYLSNYKIEYIEGSKHAYVWMQFPEVISKLVYRFIQNIE